jgi:site-specific recombinase XerD
MNRRFVYHRDLVRRLQAGALMPYLTDYAQLLLERGYSRCAGESKLATIADFGRWMERHGISVERINEQLVTSYLGVRRKHGRHKDGDRATLRLLMSHLRQTAVIPEPVRTCDAIGSIQQDYEQFLLKDRSLAPVSVAQYLPVIRRFLTHRFGKGKVRLRNLHSKDITEFVLQDSGNRGRRSAQLMTTVLRSFLRFLLQRGQIGPPLAMSVPTVAGWRLSELPRFLEVAEVEKVLRCCDRRRKLGLRDYAILLLLARLGLRGGEVTNLTLDDIDWNAGELCIHGKGSRLDRLPLPQDVGEAIVKYLRRGRPRCSCRRLFVKAKAPFDGFATPPNAICSIVARL